MGSPEGESRSFHWPEGKQAVFVPFHDVDTGGFLKRGDRSPLFLVEQKHENSIDLVCHDHVSGGR